MTDSTVVEWIEEYKETMISGGQQQTGRLMICILVIVNLFTEYESYMKVCAGCI